MDDPSQLPQLLQSLLSRMDFMEHRLIGDVRSEVQQIHASVGNIQKARRLQSEQEDDKVQAPVSHRGLGSMPKWANALVKTKSNASSPDQGEVATLPQPVQPAAPAPEEIQIGTPGAQPCAAGPLPPSTAESHAALSVIGLMSPVPTRAATSPSIHQANTLEKQVHGHVLGVDQAQAKMKVSAGDQAPGQTAHSRNLGFSRGKACPTCVLS